MNFSTEFCQWDWDRYFVFNPNLLRIQESRTEIEVYDGRWYCVDFEFGNALLEFCCFADSMVGPYSAVLPLRFILKIWSVRILDTILCSEILLWLFSPA